MDLERIILSNVSPREKVEAIEVIKDNELTIPTALIVKIVRECREEYGKFYIRTDRRAGNHWNSSISFLYEHNGQIWLCFDIFGKSTDASESVSMRDFFRPGNYVGYCSRLNCNFSYSHKDKCEVLRCILKEYVYHTEIEAEERNKAERVAKLLHHTIINPVLNEFYKQLAPRHICLEWSDKNREKYYGGKKAIEKYVDEHYKELEGKKPEELQTIYKKVFNDHNA